MVKQPFEETFDKVTKDLRNGVGKATQHLQEGMQEFLNNAIDLPKLLKMIEGMGIPDIIGMQGGSIPKFDPYTILGLNKTATNEEVKERFNKLLHKIHPDKAGVKGTEFLTQMIVLAYDLISKERGWK